MILAIMDIYDASKRHMTMHVQNVPIIYKVLTIFTLLRLINSQY